MEFTKYIDSAEVEILLLRLIFKGAFLVVSFFGVHCIASEDQGACEDFKRYLVERYENKVSLDSAINTLGKSSVNLVAIGESHMEQGRDQFYLELAQKFKNSDARFNCLLLEKDSQDQKLIELLNAKKDAEIPRTARKLYPNQDVDFQTKSALTLEGSLGMLSLAKFRDMGFHIFAVDGQGHIEAPHPQDFYDERDRAMGKRITSLLESSSASVKKKSDVKKGDGFQCQKAILIVGSSHLVRGANWLPIQSYVGQNIRIKKVKFVEPGVDILGKWDPSWLLADPDGKAICNDNPGLLKENFAFNVIPEKGAEPRNGLRGFDLAFVYGCRKDNECQPYDKGVSTPSGFLNSAPSAPIQKLDEVTP